MNPLVTVIIPVYNTEKYLKTCVDSVCLSDYGELEIILVDDGSPDDSPRICDELAKGDSRITVIHKENGGLSSARNAALDIASGEYVTFVDSDDLIKPDMISKMLEIVQNEACQIVKCGMVLTLDENDEGVKGGYTVVDKKTAMGRIFTDPPSIVTICGKLYCMDLFDDLRFPFGIINEDEFLTPRLFYKCERIALCETTGYLYMQRPGDSIMRSGFSPKKMDILNIAEDRIRLFEQWGYGDLAMLAERDYFVHLLLIRSKTRKTEFEKEYNNVKKRIKKIKFYRLSTGQKIRYILLRLGLYDIVVR